MADTPIQRILFGSPGTGKSHHIDHHIIPYELDIDISVTPENVIKTVFHPEYTYGDFMGKLVPITRQSRVEYNYFEGHFLKALSQAYRNILDCYDKNGNKVKEANNVVLVLDEINRGNSSAIFGTIFQLLDRDNDGWSTYGINITEIEFESLLELMGAELSTTKDGVTKYELKPFGSIQPETLQKKIDFLRLDLKNRKIKIPNNLSILASMNTSDNSIYFMDSAFKRRWDWQFFDWDESQPPKATYGTNGSLTEQQWKQVVTNLNKFIKDNHSSIRGIEDKQIGYFFIKSPITVEKIQNKLLFFVWDSIFNRDKKPLVELLGVKREELVTFGDFVKFHNKFIENILIYPYPF